MVRSSKLLGTDFFQKNDTFFINMVEESKKEDCLYHSHDFLEICYVCSGSGYHLVDNRHYKVYKGDLFVINFNVSHTFYKENESDNLSTYNIVLKPEFLDSNLIDFNEFNSFTLSYLFKNILTENMIKEDLRLNAEEQEDFDRLIGDIYKEYSQQQIGYMNIIRAHIIELISKIIRAASYKSMTDNLFNKNAIIINEAIKYLQQNYSKGFSLNEFAIKSFFSKNYFCKLFKETTGMSMSRYMQTLRIDKACKLLETTDKKIVDIAFEVGFSDYKSFNQIFKKIKGKRPNNYRKSRV